MSPLSLGPRAPTATLVVMNIMVCAALVYEAWRGTQVQQLLATPMRTFAPPDCDVSLPPSGAGLLGSLRDGALFYTNRRYYTPPPPGATPATPPKPDYLLVGTFLIPGKPAVALLSNASGAARKVKAGDDLDGWKVQAVEKNRVILQFANIPLEISGNAQATASGIRVVPLTPPNPRSTATGGVRTLGNTNSSAPGSAAGLATDTSSARLYRPAPK